MAPVYHFKLFYIHRYFICAEKLNVVWIKPVDYFLARLKISRSLKKKRESTLQCHVEYFYSTTRITKNLRCVKKSTIRALHWTHTPIETITIEIWNSSQKLIELSNQLKVAISQLLHPVNCATFITKLHVSIFRTIYGSNLFVGLMSKLKWYSFLLNEWGRCDDTT